MDGKAVGLGLCGALLIGGLAVAGDRAERMLEWIDTDNDGQISRSEADEFRALRFTRVDLNGDGKVTEAEMAEAMTARIARRAAKRFEKLDTNGDGAVDQSEFDRRAAARFDRIDANGDGVLSRDEIREHRGRRHRDRKGG